MYRIAISGTSDIPATMTDGTTRSRIGPLYAGSPGACQATGISESISQSFWRSNRRRRVRTCLRGRSWRLGCLTALVEPLKLCCPGRTERRERITDVPPSQHGPTPEADIAVVWNRRLQDIALTPDSDDRGP